ncbi:MAG TPA: AAA family ATPase [Tenuifilaceae bacterium]|jgi:predicted ATP-dependent endonuclease of OLD family|nr:AAA family ATPase [Bacteroidota bacterium]MZP82250.1 AAA family ATPase [Bacteroidales bacterium]NLH56832.1 AAA family ATPase [Rikenellaceae bacterium]HNV81421.1 AAA family ATPase [Tenuifilaceae bacterium]HOF91305.1 AAA family ATPase [Tenuifilaceae bacterium]
MRIRKVCIQGFRSIKEPLELNLEQVNALIGANNCGKSNILSAIYRVLGRDWVTKNTFFENDVYNEDYDTDIVIDFEFDEPFQYEQFVGIPVEIPKVRFFYTRYKKGENSGERRLEKQCLQLNDKPVFGFKSRPKKGEQPQMVPLTTIPQEIQEAFPVIFIGTDRNLKNQLPSSRNSILGTLMKDINTDFENPENLIEVGKEGSGKMLPRIERFKQAIDEAIRTLRTDEFLALEKAIKDNALKQLGFNPETETDKLDLYFNPLSSLEFYKSLEIYVKEHEYNINATELGAGFQNAIVLAILKAFEDRKKQGALFLIEEPEMYLHPQMQRSLYKTIRQIGETNQVIYITHSPHFVTIPEFNEIVIVSKNNNGTHIKKSTFKTSDALRNKFRKELDPERNEMFFARKLLIVEGDTEKMAFPEFAKRMGIDFDGVGSTIIEVGGKRNLIDFIELAISFEIPVGLVYDTDSSDFKKDEKDEEAKYNELLNSYAAKGVQVFVFEKNYEDECKKFYTEKIYQEHCQNFGRNKTLRARLMAQEETIPIPDFVKPIIGWLGS